jgi:hypothetical protein
MESKQKILDLIGPHFHSGFAFGGLTSKRVE